MNDSDYEIVEAESIDAETLAEWDADDEAEVIRLIQAQRFEDE